MQSSGRLFWVYRSRSAFLRLRGADSYTLNFSRPAQAWGVVSRVSWVRAQNQKAGHAHRLLLPGVVLQEPRYLPVVWFHSLSIAAVSHTSNIFCWYLCRPLHDLHPTYGGLAVRAWIWSATLRFDAETP